MTEGEISEWRTMANYGSMEEIDTPEKLRGYLETILTALEESTESETKLREGLREFGQHDSGCNIRGGFPGALCDCGLAALLSLEGDKKGTQK